MGLCLYIFSFAIILMSYIVFIFQFVMYDAGKRLSAEAALLQPYFYTQPLAAKIEDMPSLNNSGQITEQMWK